MVHPMVLPDQIANSMPLAIGLFVSVSAIVALCAKHARKVARNDVATTSLEKKSSTSDGDMVPKSPLRSPKKFVTTMMSNKGIPFIYHKKVGDDNIEQEFKEEEIEEGFGEGGLWQKDIMMGEKCQPLEFSGVIYYDSYGTQISELPKSPRPSTNVPPFSFPVHPNS